MLKAEKEAAHQQQQSASLGEDYSRHLYGDMAIEPIMVKTGRTWTKVQDINESLDNQEVLLRGRVHNSRVKGNLAFLVIRDHFYSIQCVASKSELISKHMLKFLSAVPNESIVEVTATVTQPQVAVESCS